MKSNIEAVMNELLPSNLVIGTVSVDSAWVDDSKKEIRLRVSEPVAYVPDLAGYTTSLKSKISLLTSKPYKVRISVGDIEIERLYSPSTYRYVAKKEKHPFVYSLDPLCHPKKGLDGKIITLWQSHGYYFEPKLNRWEWQRARIFETVEDLFTQSFVMPFLMPMLENAGAYVMSPRERDIRSQEIIIDNDGSHAVAGYAESNGAEAWGDGGIGFAYKQRELRDFQNPFIDGSYRKVASTKGKNVSVATWSAEIPEAGSYAVYVSYASLPESTSAAVYTVHSLGGDKVYRVNQKMGGGTWIYLGHFDFAAGKQTIVSLDNKTGKKGEVVTADAVKVGGGMGNIARKVPEEVTENVKSADADKVKPNTIVATVKSDYETSNHPRFNEAARYWLQWAGVPDSIYSPSNGKNDYTDDYRCRGLWVNYLAGGSSVLPDKKGLNIPVDLSFAFHSDAGTTFDDTIIGTLGIYYSNEQSTYANGSDRLNSRQLTDYVLTNICNDVRADFDSNWTRRGMWDKSYYEARVPEVPSMLLELLSHQNFADMRYGLDPTFRFTVSRAIYKGIAQFFAEKEGRSDYMIQPLPVNSFAIDKKKQGEYRLSWKSTVDTLSTRADATSFAIYERIGDGAFRQIAVVTKPEYEVKIADNALHSYRIVAINDGGVSFPSETLALGEAATSKGDVMVVNGFTRVSAPDWFVASEEIAGFCSKRDHGVPYINDISFIGDQFEFRRSLPWVDDDSAGFGASHTNMESKVVAGNTFDFAAVHGRAVLEAGYSFVSSSVAAVENRDVDLNKYFAVDLILGKQKEIQIGRGEKPNRFRTFPKSLQTALKTYCQNGGNVMVTGSYVATDLWDNENADDADRNFAREVLGYQWRVGQAAVEGGVRTVPSAFGDFAEQTIRFEQTLNDKLYAVESPDALIAADPNTGSVAMRYTENNIPAAVVAQFATHRTFVAGFPFETINSAGERNALMKDVLNFFNNKH